MTWSRRFDEPIDAGGELTTSLRDAATFVTWLTDAEQRLPHWQTAIDLLVKAADHGWPVMFAEIAMRRAIAHGRPAPAKPTRRKATRKYHVVR